MVMSGCNTLTDKTSPFILLVSPDLLRNGILIYLKAVDLAAVCSVSHLLKDIAEDTARLIIDSLKKSQLQGRMIFTPSCPSYINFLHQLSKRRIYFLGGVNNGSDVDSGRSFYEFSSSSSSSSSLSSQSLTSSSSSSALTLGQWRSLSQMKHRRGKMNACTFSGLIVIISGDNSTVCGTVEAYNPTENLGLNGEGVWFNLPNLPQNVMLSVACEVNEKLVVIGGIDRNTGEFSKDIYILSGGEEGWEWKTAQSRLPSPRYGHSSCVFQGKLYVAGGYSRNDGGDVSDSYTNTVEIYDEATDTWTPTPSPMIALRIWLHLSCIDGSLYAIGGDVCKDGTQLHPTIERLNASTGRWELITNFPKQRRVYSVAVLENKILVIGGRDQAYKELSDCDVFDVQRNYWSTETLHIPGNVFVGGDVVSMEGNIKW